MDVNEIFDTVTFTEEISKKKGFNEGYLVGKKQLLNGYHLGYHQASSLAAQLGYFNGVIEYCLNNQANLNCDQFKSDQIKQLKKDIDAFPTFNNQSRHIVNEIDEIKLKFAKLCSITKIDSTYPESEKLDF